MTSQNLQELIEKLEKKTNDTYAMLSNCYLEVGKLKEKYAEMHECSHKKVEKKDFEDHASHLCKHVERINKEVFSLCDHKDAIKAYLKIIKDEFESNKMNIEKHEKKHAEFLDALAVIKEEIKKARHELDLNMNTTVKMTKDELAAKIAALPTFKDILSLDSVKAFFKNALDACSLDASNAFVSSKNSEARLDLLEKKVESVLLKMTNSALSAK